MSRMLRAYLQAFLLCLGALIVSEVFGVDAFFLIGATIVFQLSILWHDQIELHNKIFDLFFEEGDDE